MWMSEVIKVLVTSNTEEETWSWEARDILLDTWTALLMVINSNIIIKMLLVFPLILVEFILSESICQLQFVVFV